MSHRALALARALGSSALPDPSPSVTKISASGTVNEVFRVRGAEEDVVVRLNADPYRFGEFEKEAVRMAVARSHGIPVPEILETGRRDGFAFQIQSFVAGTHPSSSDLQVWEELGATVRRLHSISSPDDENPWRAQVEYGLSQLGASDELRQTGLLTAELSEDLEARWSELHDLPLGLSHGDVALRNVLRPDDGSLVLLDWGSSEFDVVPFADLGGLVGEIEPGTPPFTAFLSGYGADWKDLKETLRATATLKAVDLCRWAIERRPSDLDRCLRQARWAFGVFLDDREWEPKPVSF